MNNGGYLKAISGFKTQAFPAQRTFGKGTP
jgi:hypothetical protein